MSKPIPRAIGHGQAQLDQQKWVLQGENRRCGHENRKTGDEGRLSGRPGSSGGRIAALCGLVVDMRPQIRTVEEKVARLAGNSHGVVSRDELLRSGMTPAQIKSRIARG